MTFENTEIYNSLIKYKDFKWPSNKPNILIQWPSNKPNIYSMTFENKNMPIYNDIWK